ncbi:FunK1 protein kinase [Apiospora phragmitis]|uniref:non-specific serine/threonine protein kinase n=1 Tax=Apiospora phragmitis TaxID=2905665 RepID=A0ABR1TAZ6_9PEZI
MTNYVMMSDEEASFTSFIRHDDLGSYFLLRFPGESTTTNHLYLEDEPIAAPDYFVGPGTTCYAARARMSQTAGFVVKFAWREEVAHRERELLELAKERKVWGVIRALGWEDLGTILGLRKGILVDHKLCKSMPAAGDGKPTSEYGTPVINKEYAPPFIDRTFSCTATYPLGRPINQFETISEFLEACRDVAKVLRSLYQDGKILHRDICIENLIIPVRRIEGEADGVLIDLDNALDLERGPARRGRFMAIGILRGDPHTYRHDLESLFYVFVWIAICNNNNRERDDDGMTTSLRQHSMTSLLWGWCTTDLRAVSESKSADMSLEGFLNILGEFSSEFRRLEGLARRLHGLLFPVREGAIFTGTDVNLADTNRLYDGVIHVFDEVIISQTQQ